MNALTQHIAVPVADGEILSPRDTVRVIGLPHPFKCARIVADVPAGLSIAEILDLVAATHARLPSLLIVEIDGQAIYRCFWQRVRPKPGTVLTFRAVLQNGDALKTALGLAIAVAALFVAGPLAGALGFTAGTALFAGATAVIGAGIIVGGTLALNALFPARPAQLADSSSVNGPSFTRLASIQGARNQATPYEAVPVVLGEHRLSPPYAAKPYTELIGDEQYLRVVFCWGYSVLTIDSASLKIGETPLSSFDQVDYNHFVIPGGTPRIYPSVVDEQALAIELNSLAATLNPVPPFGLLYTVLDDGQVQWASRTTAPNCDLISIDVTFPQGVFFIDDKGNTSPWYASFRAQYRVVNSGSAWTNLIRDGVFTREVKTTRLGARASVVRNQYEVRVGKSSTSAIGNAKYQDKCTWTALRSFTIEPPFTPSQPLLFTELLIKATDQLSGVIDTFNGVVTSNAAISDGSSWLSPAPTSNPASLFRLVLQGAANAQPVADAQLDLTGLLGWYNYCAAQGFSFNQVRARSSVYEALADIAAAGRAVPTFIDGKWGVVWDRPTDPIVQHFTPRNSWGFAGSHPYARLPHGFRVRFINAQNAWTDDERVVYDDGYNASNATLFEALEFPGVTDPNLIWRHGRFHIAQSRLRPERVTINTDWEHLVATRGDRVRLTHDVLLIGLASGRLKTIAGQVVTLDETITIDGSKSYGLRFRLPDPNNTSVYRSVNMTGVSSGDYNQFTLTGDLTALAAGNLFSFGETSLESAVYRVFAIAHQKDLIAQLILVDDAPEIASADTGAIPAYNPHITIPPDPFTLPPQHLTYAEVVDGAGATVRALLRLSWTLPRLGKTQSFEIQRRDDDAGGNWRRFDIILAPATICDIPTTSPGFWSFRVRCIFDDGTTSAWASIIDVQLVGLSFAPNDVKNLREEVINGQTYLSWDTVSDPRTLLYEVRKGASWAGGLTVGGAVPEAKFASTGDGTYWVAAYVVSPFFVNIYSADPISIAIAGTTLIRNVIVAHDEFAEHWPGRLFGGVIDTGLIRTNAQLGSTIVDTLAADIVSQFSLQNATVAIYLSSRAVDIGRPAECRFSCTYEGVGSLVGENILALTDLLADPDFLGSANTEFIAAFPIWRFSESGANDVFQPADVFAQEDVFVAGNIPWTPWINLASGTRYARWYRVGLVLISNKTNVNAVGTKMSWLVDVPDRNDDYTNLTVPAQGLAVTFYPSGFDSVPAAGDVATPFNGGPNDAPLPHVQRAIVNGQPGDEVRITNLSLAGLTATVLNNGVGVPRSGVNLLVRGF